MLQQQQQQKYYQTVAISFDHGKETVKKKTDAMQELDKTREREKKKTVK